MTRRLACLLLLLAPGPAAAQEPGEHLSIRFDHDSFFGSYPTVTFTHPLSERDSVYGDFVDYVGYHSIELDAGWTRAYGPWSVWPALGATAGPGAWGLGSDKRTYVGRDVVPQLGFYYSDADWEGEAYHAAWIPTQESRDSSIGYTQTLWWAVRKYRVAGIGPHLETFGTKEGRSGMRLSHVLAGVHLLKELPKGCSFQLFLGYDPIRLSSYLGEPKRPSAAFRASFIYPLL
ncbi:MAG TPA: DUF6733 family protein [Elusimicrobiota bacterium]|jgi:hypothetical protein|nr:DUF6733 family protein [Elusimicrobiota bacterium]